MSRLDEIASRWIIPTGGKAYWPDGCEAQDEDVRYLIGIARAAERMDKALGAQADSCSSPGCSVCVIAYRARSEYYLAAMSQESANDR